MSTIEVNGVELCVEQVGSGPPALIMHGGLGIDHRAYRGLDPLASALRLVYYDHRGNGRSQGSADTSSMRQWASDAAELALAVAGDEPVIVIGHSFGGFIAQEMLVSHPDRVRAAVLVATTPGQLGEGEAPAPEGPPMPEEFAELLASMPDTNEALAVSMNAMAGAYLHRVPVAELQAALADVTFRADAMRRGFEELATWSSVDRLADVDVPVLLVAGRHDAFTAWPQSERIASRLRDAEVVVLEQSGHFPWLDEAETFFPAVTGWLRRRALID